MGDVATMARVEIGRAIFAEEVERLARGGRRKVGEAILSYGDEGLVITAGGGETRLPATGRWPGEARASFAWLQAMAQMPPDMDPLVLEVRDGRLRMGNNSVLCKWQRNNSAVLELPVNAGWLDLLRAGIQHDDDALAKSGVLKEVREARQHAEERLRRAYPLFCDFGVTIEDLERVVREALMRAPSN